MIDTNKHYRLAIYLAAYDPYKDVFDIFIKQFEKNWPDCPYPLIIANMYFKYDGRNTVVINCGNEKDPMKRKEKAIQAIDADYYLGFEEDRIIMDRVNTLEIEKILDFMDKENVPYFRCNSSVFKKKERNRFPGYPHYYHIVGNEPYGVCGSTVIWRKDLIKRREEMGLGNGYCWESFQNKRAATTNEKWVENYATDDRNIFHIIHCIEKQKWIVSSKRKLEEAGYIVKGRKTQSFKETLLAYTKDLFKRIPGKMRHYIKRLLNKIGLKFETDY